MYAPPAEQLFVDYDGEGQPGEVDKDYDWCRFQNNYIQITLCWELPNLNQFNSILFLSSIRF